MPVIRCLVPTCEALQRSCSHPCTSFWAQEPSASGFSLNRLLAPGWLGSGRRSRLWLGLWAALRGGQIQREPEFLGMEQTGRAC